MEIADVFVVNKADMDGADLVIHDLQRSLDSVSPGRKPRRVVACSALRSEGIDELVLAISEHHQYLCESDLLTQALANRMRSQILSIAQSKIGAMLAPVLGSSSTVEQYVEQILRGETDPVTAGDEVAQRLLAGRW